MFICCCCYKSLLTYAALSLIQLIKPPIWCVCYLCLTSLGRVFIQGNMAALAQHSSQPQFIIHSQPIASSLPVHQPPSYESLSAVKAPPTLPTMLTSSQAAALPTMQSTSSPVVVPDVVLMPADDTAVTQSINNNGLCHCTCHITLSVSLSLCLSVW